MNISLPYGKSSVDIDVSGINATVLTPRFTDGLADEKSAFFRSIELPIGTSSLVDAISPDEKVAIVIPDITRPFPSDRVLPWLFEALSHLPKENFVIVNGTGSHRGNTPDELRSMVGDDVYNTYRIINHDGHDAKTWRNVGSSKFGYDVFLNREYVEADRRIVLGFIEPHFMAGFSGGCKAVFPGVAGIDSIMHYHGASVIGDPLSTWGNLVDNPTQEHVRDAALKVPIDFCVNVALNKNREITRFFCGEVIAAHEAGCKYVKDTAMIECDEPFPIVISNNNGFPLDQNLYQAVKGMSAAAQIVKPDGLILMAAECSDGFPDHGNFKKLLFEYENIAKLLEDIMKPGFAVFDQWQIQLMAMICAKARVAVQCEIDDESIRKAYLTPVRSIQEALEEELDRIGRDAPVAILPEGPVTVPYLKG